MNIGVNIHVRTNDSIQAQRAPIDIMTFAGFCDSRDELLAHVARYEAQVAEGK